MTEKPCAYKRCPAFASPKSGYGYCPVHHRVATDGELADLARKGKASAELRVFVADLDRWMYPRGW
jgi:uncharacterized Zn finger protein (UPF0148 family)